MYIYADVFLLVNVILNGVILVLTAWGAGIEFKVWRVLTAAALGSLYALGGLAGDYWALYSPVVKVVVSIVLVMTAFTIRSFRLLGVVVACFYTVSFFLGGAVIGWLIFFQQDILGPTGGLPLLSLSWKQLTGGVVAAILLAVIVFHRLAVSRSGRKLILPVVVSYAGRQVSLTALLDTGNRLFAGFRPVVIVTYEAVKPVLSEQAQEYLQNNGPAAWLANLPCCQDAGWLSRVEVITYRAVGVNNMLLGFRPDGLKVLAKSGEIETDSVVLGIHQGRLTADNSFQALLHPGVIHAVNAKGGTDVCA